MEFKITENKKVRQMKNLLTLHGFTCPLPQTTPAPLPLKKKKEKQNKIGHQDEQKENKDSLYFKKGTFYFVARFYPSLF